MKSVKKTEKKKVDKEKGKKLGTKWDPKKKKWYIMSNLEKNNKEIILNQWGQ